jgi:2-methylisocitrate lyase-like PEP mutase family enzyme
LSPVTATDRSKEDPAGAAAQLNRRLLPLLRLIGLRDAAAVPQFVPSARGPARYRRAMASSFRALHALGRLLILPNAWDAGSARVIAACGAEAIATTSAGLAWARGYPDGNVLPAAVLESAVRDIARAIDLPLSIDVEAGYTADPRGLGELIAMLAGAGVAGINLEDGGDAPDLLCAKIAAVRRAAGAAGIDLFINARTDIYLRGLVAADQAVSATIDRARRYRDAGCDGLFVPGLTAPDDLRTVVAAIDPLPLNAMALAGLPAATELRRLGVRRLSAGSAIAQAAYGRTRQLAADFLATGSSDLFADGAISYAEMNTLASRQPRAA